MEGIRGSNRKPEEENDKRERRKQPQEGEREVKNHVASRVKKKGSNRLDPGRTQPVTHSPVVGLGPVSLCQPNTRLGPGLQP